MKNEEFNKMFRLLDSSVGQLSQHFFDDFVEENASRYLSSGLRSVIIRRQLGQCCDFCAGLVGVYDYGNGDFPKNIFVRHRDCKCLVTVKTEKGGYTDVWSKKEYDSQRKARNERLEEISRQDLNIRNRDKTINIARDQGKKYADLTEYYNNSPKEEPAEVLDTIDTFTVDGRQLPVNGPNKEIIFEPSEKEREVAEWYADIFGGKIQLMPKINKPSGHKLGDYMLNGNELIDLKSPVGSGRWTINNQFSNHKGQAETFILDITDCALETEEVYIQLEEMLSGNNKEWVKKVITKRGNKILKVYERI